MTQSTAIFDPVPQQISDLQQENSMQSQFIRDLMDQLSAKSRPFDETEDFRDFVIWLCGFVDRDSAPNDKEWGKLQDRVKHVAAEFTLRAKDRAKEERDKRYAEQLQGKLWRNGMGGATGHPGDLGTTTTTTTAVYDTITGTQTYKMAY